MFDAGHLHLLSAVATIAALAVENTRSLESLELQNQLLKAEAHFDIIGDRLSMHDLYRFIAKVAPTESNVIVYGESGTGKELVARAIHQNSRRAEKTFVAINCAALTETLLESELFGYEKGAFTGALAQKRGYLEAADGGTIFLDEIGELASTCRPSCFASCKNAKWFASAARARSRSTFAFSPPPISR